MMEMISNTNIFDSNWSTGSRLVGINRDLCRHYSSLRAINATTGAEDDVQEEAKGRRGEANFYRPIFGTNRRWRRNADIE